jgi:hypothetical protein
MLKMVSVLLFGALTGCASMSQERKDEIILSMIMPSTHFDTVATITQLIASTPPRDWVALWEKAHTPEMFEDAYQAMLLHEDDRLFEQAITRMGRFGVQNVGKNPPHPLEKEAMIFWMTWGSFHKWQDNPNDAEAKRICLLSLARLKHLKQKNKHSEAMMFRLQEMAGEKPEGSFPQGKKRWEFSSSGNYKLYNPPSDLRKTLGLEKIGGSVIKTLSIACMVLTVFQCKPKLEDDLVISKVSLGQNLWISLE